jgi:hypothetical protein
MGGDTEISAEVQEVTKEEITKEDLQYYLDEVNSPYIYGAFRTNIENIMLEIEFFTEYGSIIEEASHSTDAEVVELSKQLAIAVGKLQAVELPGIRTAYCNIIRRDLWVENIDVTWYGKNIDKLTFTSGLFASNYCIQEFQKQISSTVSMLGFKRVNYKWYEGAEEYTYYDVHSLADSEIK